jgi:hypothetical protein
VRAKLERAGFRVERLSWANSVLFPPAAAKRLLEHFTAPADPLANGHAPSRGAEPDLWQPPSALNAVLEGLVAVEAVALRRGLSLPFGLSLLAVARAV